MHVYERPCNLRNKGENAEKHSRIRTSTVTSGAATIVVAGVVDILSWSESLEESYALPRREAMVKRVRVYCTKWIKVVPFFFFHYVFVSFFLFFLCKGESVMLVDIECTKGSSKLADLGQGKSADLEQGKKHYGWRREPEVRLSEIRSPVRPTVT